MPKMLPSALVPTEYMQTSTIGVEYYQIFKKKFFKKDNCSTWMISKNVKKTTTNKLHSLDYMFMSFLDIKLYESTKIIQTKHQKHHSIHPFNH